MLYIISFTVTLASVIYGGASHSDLSDSGHNGMGGMGGYGGGRYPGMYPQNNDGNVQNDGNAETGNGGIGGYAGNGENGGYEGGDGRDYTDCDYIFTNRDFYDGTFRIRRSGKYCLGENIVLNPRYGDIESPNKYGSWFPVNDQAFPGSVSHDDGGWALGFFSGITIEVSYVELDLMGFQISMSKAFYLQQRFFNIIEIQNTPFNFDQGPANFGQTVPKIRNVHIKNGRLGRSSHNGIHAFDVEIVGISNLHVFDFEVCGVQFNGFRDIMIKNVRIGPSATDVPFWGYYSHGRFSLNGFELIDKKEKKYVRFNDGRELTVQKIMENLRTSLDIAYRFEMGKTTEIDKEHPLYKISVEMYRNPFRIPDGSALYGILLNSKGLAVQGFGDSDNLNAEQGNKVVLENVNIDGLHLNVNEIPALYFDRCEGYYYNDDGTKSITPVLGRFGDVFDTRRAMKYEDWDMIDRGFGVINEGYSYRDIRYDGNPLSDAQVALGIFSAPFTSNWGLKGDRDNTRAKETFYQWATDSGYKYDRLPNCARFICNADAMFHLNKGIVAIRMDGIENAVLKDVHITNLYNESPLASMACASYRGPFDGGQPSSLEREGYMGTDIRAIAIINGGAVEIHGKLLIDTLISSYGDVIGIHGMDDCQMYVNGDDHKFNNLQSGAAVSSNMYQQLVNLNTVPYPNNFYDCNIKTEQLRDRQYEGYPYDYKPGAIDHSGRGYIYPNGIITAECRELYFDENEQPQRRLF